MAEPQANMFGKTLNKIRSARWSARHQAEQELWKRNGLDNPTKREGYKLAETKVVHRDGKEVTELRLYKLVDAAVITIESEIRSTIEDGIAKLRENNR